MRGRQVLIGIASWAAGLAGAFPAQAQDAQPPTAASRLPGLTSPGPVVGPATRIPLDKVSAKYRERVRGVIDRPTLRTQGPAEAFNCQPAFYYWLLDHPDLAVRLWRGLGITCADIQDRGEGRFGWQDDQGSAITWYTVLSVPDQRVWFAEGHVKPGLLLPTIAVRAVVCLRHRAGQDEDGQPAIRHQVELHLQTDSRALALAARLFGASAPRLAEQYTGQIQTFYAGLAGHFEQNPEKAQTLLAEIRRTEKATSRKRASRVSGGSE